MIHYHGRKFLLTLYQKLLVTKFLDVMGRTVKIEYHTSLACIWKAFISHNHKQDFLCWDNLIVRHFVLSIYKISKKEFENPGFFIYRDCPTVTEWEILEIMNTKGSSFKKPKKLECPSSSWNAQISCASARLLSFFSWNTGLYLWSVVNPVLRASGSVALGNSKQRELYKLCKNASVRSVKLKMC